MILKESTKTKIEHQGVQMKTTIKPKFNIGDSVFFLVRPSEGFITRGVIKRILTDHATENTGKIEKKQNGDNLWWEVTYSMQYVVSGILGQEHVADEAHVFSTVADVKDFYNSNPTRYAITRSTIKRLTFVEEREISL